MRKQTISAEEYEQIVAAEKATQDKQISRKLRGLMLRYKGLSNEEAGKQLGLCSVRISQLVNEYKRVGLESFAKKKYGGNHRSLSEAEEEEILNRFREQAEAGQVVIVADIKRAFDERLGKDTGRGYIYMLLARHDWRKVMPRQRHPKKADDATIEASKKLKPV
jgi:transposase